MHEAAEIASADIVRGYTSYITLTLAKDTMSQYHLESTRSYGHVHCSGKDYRGDTKPDHFRPSHSDNFLTV